MKHYFNTAAMWKIWVDLVIIWWKPRKCYCERSELYAPLCKEKLILIYRYTTQYSRGWHFWSEFVVKNVDSCPSLSLVILMHPTTLYSYYSVWLPGLEKLHQFQQEFANNFTQYFPAEVRQFCRIGWLFNFCWRWCNHFMLCATQIFVPTLVTSDTGSIVFIF